MDSSCSSSLRTRLGESQDSKHKRVLGQSTLKHRCLLNSETVVTRCPQTPHLARGRGKERESHCVEAKAKGGRASSQNLLHSLPSAQFTLYRCAQCTRLSYRFLKARWMPQKLQVLNDPGMWIPQIKLLKYVWKICAKGAKGLPSIHTSIRGVRGSGHRILEPCPSYIYLDSIHIFRGVLVRVSLR